MPSPAPRPWRTLFPALTVALASCGGGAGVAAAPASVPAPPPAPASAPSPSTWTLVWSDEFDGAAGSAPNAANWGYDLGNQEAGGWGNHELEYYTNSTKNAQLDGMGHLVITAQKDGNAGPCWNGVACGYTSARLLTQGKVSFTYGKVEARIQVPAGQGLWPAFWTLGDSPLPWPSAGEIDIMEYVGKTPNAIYGTAHGPGYSGANGIGKAYTASSPIAGDFHIFTVIKRPNEISWQIDGVEYHRITPSLLPAGTNWVFERPYFVILNLAVGGDWPGLPDATTVFPAQMTVDWVRIYKEN